MPKVLLRCGENGCGTPFAAIQNGYLVIESRHHGRVHLNRISLKRLKELLEGVTPTVPVHSAPPAEPESSTPPTP